MRDLFLSLISHIGSALTQKMFALLLGAVLLLILYGAIPEERLLLLLLFIVCARATFLAHLLLRKRRSASDWEILHKQLLARYRAMDKKVLGVEALSSRENENSSPEDLAKAIMESTRERDAHMRPRGELLCETLGLLAFGLVIPIDIALYTNEFVSVRAYQGWDALVIITASFFLYALPFIWPRSLPSLKGRMLWWGAPLLPALIFLYTGITSRHEYLNPFHPDHERLAANRVLALRDVISAGRHADWIIRYARLLDQKGDIPGSVRYYREGLRLDTNQNDVRQRLSELGALPQDMQSPGAINAAWEYAHKPFWSEWQAIPSLQRCDVDRRLENLSEMTAVIVPIGEVEEWLIDAVGYAIQNELGLPVCAVPRPVPMPPHTRVRGIIGGKQWHADTLLKAFAAHAMPLPKAPVRFVFLTSVDMYAEDANYIFSASSSWGGLVATARFGESVQDRPILALRTAKQSISALMQAFGVPKSSDRNCVTSYTHNLAEVDAKGNRPNAESLAAFKRIVGSHNLSLQAASRASKANK